ncbi:MAG: hypothetical protein M0R32_05810 [Candidatus Cloacimonetes bacterium]|nr:hypothetical protein [Candidatus Cloacimonadota bacterium]
MKLICMSFDGDFQRERPSFETEQEGWEYADDIGSRWFFYPFCFLVSESGKTIVDAPERLEWTIGKRVDTIARIFKSCSQLEEAEGMEVDPFVFLLDREWEHFYLHPVKVG